MSQQPQCYIVLSPLTGPLQTHSAVDMTIGGIVHATYLHLCVPLQPSNILEFGARYFADILYQRDGGVAPTRSAADMPSTSDKDASMDVEDTATMLDIANLTPAELEPILMSEQQDALAHASAGAWSFPRRSLPARHDAKCTSAGAFDHGNHHG